MKKSLLILLFLVQYTFSADLFFSTEAIFPEIIEGFEKQVERFEKSCGNSIKIDVQKVVSNRPEIDAQINQDIPNQTEINAYYKNHVGEILELEKETTQEEADVTNCVYELTYTPQYIGYYKNIEQIKVYYYEYAGGAHGVFSDNYYLFDGNNQRLTLQLLLDEQGKEKLDELLEVAYRKFLEAPNGEKVSEEDGLAVDAEYLASVKENANNFLFTEKGLMFSYAPYGVGAYALGQIELFIPYSELTGIIKAQYLPE